MPADYYEVLGVARDASEDEIKRAYRALARRYHPDANSGDTASERKFKEVAEAFTVLSDPESRRNYDRYGTAAAPPSFDPFDIFATFFGRDPFGGVQTRGTASRGTDLAMQMEVTLEEIVTGVTKKVTIPKLDECPDCSGSGAAAGSGAVACPDCGGAGVVRSVRRSLFGNLMTSYTCPSCGGEGRQLENPCGACGGEGRIDGSEEVSVQVPPGVPDGARIRISGAGEAGRRGAAAGDLYVQIRQAPDPRFVRRGDELLATIGVPFTQAALGAILEVGTVDGLVELEIAPGTQPGEVLRVRGHGLPRFHGYGRGDLLVEVAVEVPERLTKTEEELLRSFANERGETVSDGKGIVEKIRAAFRS